MISQSIRTSKYTTTIDIPAEKLHTRAKFIQIEKNPYQRQEVISIPNPCCGQQQERRQVGMETKLMIEQLQQAYNQDVQALENKITSMKTSQDIEKLKFENQIQLLKKDREVYIKRAEISQNQLQKMKNGLEDKVQNLQRVLKSKDQQLFTKDTEIQKLKREINHFKEQIKEKDSLLLSKFRDFEISKDQKYLDERRAFESKIDSIIRQSSQTKTFFQQQLKKAQNECENKTLSISQLQKEINSYKDEISELKKLNVFQNNEIETYIKNLKDLESQKKNGETKVTLLHVKIEAQNIQIQKLLQEMRQQRIQIETQIQARPRENSIGVGVDTSKLHECSVLLEQKQKEFLQNKTQYLLKLQEIDEERHINRVLKQEITKLNDQIYSLKLEIKTLEDNQQHLKNELTKKIFEYNELLKRPPQIYEVKIQKSIERKDYITELEMKITEFERNIQQMTVQNESYAEEIQKKVKQIELQKSKQLQLIKTIEQLKIYISNREKSIGWAVEREIMKDVEISKEVPEQFNGYRVFVKNSTRSEQTLPGINIELGSNFNTGSKLQQILSKKHLSQVIYQIKDPSN